MWLSRRHLATAALATAATAAVLAALWWADRAASGGATRHSPAPELRYTLLDGQQLHARDLRGQVVLVNFWATSCAVCVAEMPALAAMHQKYRGQGLQTLAVAMRYDPPARVFDFATRWQLPFGVVIDNTGAIAQGFGDVQATPTGFLINKRGDIVHRFEGAPDMSALQRRVARLLAES